VASQIDLIFDPRDDLSLNKVIDQDGVSTDVDVVPDVQSDRLAGRLTGSESILVLLLLLFSTSLRFVVTSMPQFVRYRLIVFFGIRAITAPLAIRVAPCTKVWLSLFAMSLLSTFLYWTLVLFVLESRFKN